MATKADMRVTATGQARAGGALVRALHVVGTGTGGRVTVRDGGGSGAVKIDVDTPAAAGPTRVDFGPGIIFSTDVHVSALSNITAATFVYDDLA